MHERRHKEEFHRLNTKLKGMRLIPFFFSPLPPTATFHDIDALKMLDCVVSLTGAVSLRHGGSSSTDAPNRQLVWFEGATMRLMLAFVSTHIESLSERGDAGSAPQNPPPLLSSWSGLTTAVGLYLNAVLGLWNAGEPINPRLHRRVLTILLRDLEGTIHLANSDSLDADLWLWKAFVGSFSLVVAPPATEGGMLHALEATFEGLVCEWSRASGVKDWDEAQASLARIVWPHWFRREELAKALWLRSISQQG